MNKKHLTIFIGVVAIQILVLLGLFGSRVYTLTSGVEVLLRTEPVDPRDLVRGDYVNLRYEISNVASYLVRNDEYPEPGDTVYVQLIKNSYDDFWRASGVSLHKPGDYGTYIRGTVTDVEASGRGNFIDPFFDSGLSVNSLSVEPFRGNLSIEYGIEKYFVEAGTGLDLERSGRLKVKAVVDRQGNSVIKGVEEMTEAEQQANTLNSARPVPVDDRPDLAVTATHDILRKDGVNNLIITVTVKNQGNTTAPPSKLYTNIPSKDLGENTAKIFDIPELGPDESHNVQRIFKEGDLTAVNSSYLRPTFFADYEEVIDEVQEYNNSTTIYIR